VKVQFFTNRHTWEIEKKRYPFAVDAFKAIEKLITVEYGGIGWELKEPTGDCDFIIIHAKRRFPILLGSNYTKDEKEWNQYPGKKIILFDEMFYRAWVKNKIENTGAAYIIGNYGVDRVAYWGRGFNFNFERWAVIPHCVDTTLFKDYREKKTTDILLTGSMSSRYQFRRRLKKLLEEKLSKLCSVKIISKQERKNSCFLGGYARQINRSKITICTSSNFKYRLAKYAEIPLCNSLMAGDVPRCEDARELERMMCVLTPTMTNEEIAEKLLLCLKDDSLRKKKQEFGRKYTERHFSQEKYAERFVEVLKEWNK